MTSAIAENKCESLGFAKSGLKLGASMLVMAAAVIASPVLAQDDTTDSGADDGEEDVIIVEGFRQSLQNAQALKRDADTIVDSVTAEDIGALPDRSVTETLQRIPGISINRFAAGVDPDHFSVEGSGVVVRGLTYVRSEFNGREAFTANNGRALGFADVPSELLGGVDVFKSPSADRIEGGIAGVVNLRTRLPFDSNGLVVAGSLELNYGDFAKEATPTGAIVLSNVWDTPIGEIGVLGSFSYSQLISRADRFQVSSFRVRPIYTDGERTDVVNFAGATQQGSGIFPRGGVQGTQEFDRERYGYAAAVQWKSLDDRAEATFQFLRSDARQAWTEHTVEIATDNVANNGDSRAVAGTSIEFDSTGLFSEGYITGPTGWRADAGDPASGDFRTPAMALQSNNIRRDRGEQAVTSDYAFNFKYDVTDNLGINLDYQHVDSWVDVVDNTLWATTFQDAYLKLNGTDFPTVRFLPPQNCVNYPCTGTPGTGAWNGASDYPSYFTGEHQDYSDPFNSFWRAAMDHIEQSEGKSDSFRFDADYTFPDSGFLESIQAGVYHSNRNQTARFSTYNWGRLSEIWGNNGPVWLDENVDGIPGGSGGAPQGNYEPFCFDDFFRNSVENPANDQCRLFYAGNTVTEYEEMIAYANQYNREWEAMAGSINGGWRSLADRPGVVSGTPFLRGEINTVQEKNTAGYLMARFDTDLGDGGANLSGNIGVRYSHTNRVAPGVIQFANNPGAIPTEQQCLDVPDGQDPPGFCTFTPEVRAQARGFLNGAVFENDAEKSYDYWLPSFNAKLDLGNGLQFRAAYFKGVAPPQFGYVRNYFNITGLTAVPVTDANGTPIPGEYTIQSSLTAANPNLLPTTADNFDLTAEWYFDDQVGQLSVSLFYKRLKDVLTNASIRQDLTNNNATYTGVITTPINSPDIGKIKGFEIAYQQVYDFLPSFLSGLGLQANYTYVESTGVPQSTLSPTDPDVAAGRQPTITGDNFPLQGLSKHQVNITPFIDIGPVSMRASYNWRSRYLLTLRDVITPFDPIFQEGYGQIDASITVSLFEHFKIGVQAVNLTNSVTKTSAAVTDQNGDIRLVPRGWYMNDRRYSLIARFNF